MRKLALVTFQLVLSAFCLADTFKDEVLPLTSTPAIGSFRTKKALEFIDELIAYSEKYAPGVVRDFVNQDYFNKYKLAISESRIHVFRGVGVIYSKRTGEILTVGLYGGAADQPKNVDADECVRRAKEFYRFVGGKYDLKLSYLDESKNLCKVNMVFTQIIPGEKYAVGGDIEVVFDQNVGLPEVMEMSYPPEIERAHKEISSEDAGSAAAAAAMQFTGWERVEVGVFEPRYIIPSYSGLPNAMSERHRRLVKESKANLIYEVSVNDSTSWNESEKRFDRFVQVYVDGETGLAIAALPAYRMRGGASARIVKAKDADITWSCGKAEGKLVLSDQKTPEDGKPVVLKNSKNGYLKGKYSRKAGLLYYSANGEPFVFKPDRSLRKELGRYKAGPYAKQPELKTPEKAKTSQS